MNAAWLLIDLVAADPEALLLIEARETDGARQWHYALAQMNRGKSSG
jgi:hypothetical protein